MSGKTWKHLVLKDVNDVTKWKKTDIKCPACSRFLWMVQLENGMGKTFWCGTGPCPSIAANNGASSIELLRKNVEEEEESE